MKSSFLKFTLWLLALGLCLSATPLRAHAARRELPGIGAAVRWAPEPDSQAIGYLEPGTALEVLGREGNYYRIDCYGMTGYLPRELVRRDEEGWFVHCPEERPGTRRYLARTLQEGLPLRGRLTGTAMEYLGVPYVSGGSSPKGFDCSGFVQYVFAGENIRIPRTCDGQMAAGLIIPRENLQPGDLVLFQGTTRQKAIATHVGIYLGNDKIIHAGSRGITVADLNSSYFSSHYLCARRLLVLAGRELFLPETVRNAEKPAKRLA